MERFLVSNGTVFRPISDTPTVATFLESFTGVYTTTRTHNGGKSLLFWDRHLSRLNDSARILFGSSDPQNVSSLVNKSFDLIFPVALSGKRHQENNVEFTVTAVLTDEPEGLAAHVHLSSYFPLQFGLSGRGAHLAVVGPGRFLPQAKHTKWVRQRKPLEKKRPQGATELLLSNDGDKLLEGSITNFFVVARASNSLSFELYTAPIREGVLPGIIRQLVIEVCICEGINVREESPSWSNREHWVEAFITNSLRIVEHVENIKVPKYWDSLQENDPSNISWVEKVFQVSGFEFILKNDLNFLSFLKNEPGPTTKLIQEKVMMKATV